MPRNKTLDIGCLNIVSHPHSPEIYIQLFSEANTSASVKIADHQYCRIRHIRPIDNENPNNGIKGKILKHLQWTENDEWLDDRTDEVANSTDVKDVVPDHLLPGLIQFDFVFYPDGHRLFFAMKNDKNKYLGPSTAQKIIHSLLTQLPITAEQGLDLNVHVESSHEGLERLFGLKVIQSIEFEVELPNPDENNKAQEKYKKRLEKQKIRKKHSKLYSAKNESIVPDNETKAELKVAASNGYVSGKGIEENGTKGDISTKDHPFKERESYQPRWTITDILIKVTPDYLRDILARFD